MNMKTRLLAMVVGIALVSAACDYVSQPSWIDPGNAIDYEWSAAIPLEKGYPTVCDDVMAYQVLSWQCWSVRGHEETGDWNNWIVTPIEYRSVLSADGFASSKYGGIMVMNDGVIYAGCDFRSPSRDYLCDYQFRNFTAPWPQNSDLGGTSYMLKKTINWTKYVGSSAGCALGITSVMAGGAMWQNVWLTGCVMGPL